MRAIFYLLAAAPAALLAAPQAQAQDFVGPRVEASIGYDAVRVDDVPAGIPDSLDAVRVGGAIGYDFAIGERFTIGAEAGIGWDIDASTRATAGNVTVDFKPGYDFDASLRLGYRAGESTLVFAKGGWANSEYTVTTTTVGTSSTTVTKVTDDEDGYRLGLGVEQAFGEHLYAKAEYRFTDYGDDVTRHQALIGVGYRF